MKVLTKKQLEVIKDNLTAWKNNFGFIKFSKADYGGGIFVYTSEEDFKTGNYIQFCNSIDYLNGWLYGCVQGVHRLTIKLK